MEPGLPGGTLPSWMSANWAICLSLSRSSPFWSEYWPSYGCWSRSAAYTRIGLNPRGAMLVQVVSLAGSYFNIPLAELP